MNRRVVIRLYY